MAKYKVLKEFALEGTDHTVDSEIELLEDAAAPLVENGTLELVAEASNEANEDKGDDADQA